MECCSGDPFSPPTQCCTSRGVRPKTPISRLDFIGRVCEDIRQKEGFNWPDDPQYDGCTVEEYPQLALALLTYPFYSGDKDNPAGFDDTHFATEDTGPCYLHDACYFACSSDPEGHGDCNSSFAADLTRVCMTAEPSHIPQCALFAQLYVFAVTAAGPIIYPGSQQRACQCC